MVRAMIEEEWDPETWNGDMWENVLRDLNPQNLLNPQASETLILFNGYYSPLA